MIVKVRGILAVLLLAGFSPAVAISQDTPGVPTTILVGPTVHVSAAYPNMPHYENLAAGNLTHPGQLITCSGTINALPEQFYDQYCYASFDDGASWEPTLRLNQRWSDFDPVVAYGLGDDAYAASLVYNIEWPFWDPSQPAPKDQNTIVYKSTDGGHTWREAARFGFIDREDVIVDTTQGKYSGTVYVAGQGSVNDITGAPARDGIFLWRSTDGGKTFLGPVVAAYAQNSILAGVATGAVLSDGTYVIMFDVTKPGMGQSENLDHSPNAEVRVITSRDGGQTFDTSHKVADTTLDRPRSEGSIIGELAADPGSACFKDRLYAVFPAVIDGRVQIALSYSADKGKTWSKPVIVNDDRSPVQGGHGPDQLLPSVAVNKDGVVMVTWYDRRDAKDNLGWQVRAGASLDGGQTFSNSVAVSPSGSSFGATQPWDVDVTGGHNKDSSLVSISADLNGFYQSGGHTSGLAAAADGTFHPTWIDNHTGVAQLWSSSLTVQGTVYKNGSPDLANLDDISKSVSLELAKPQFDRATGTVTVSARLRNTSKTPIIGPVKLRVLTVTSGLGVPEITNANNGMDGAGAIWDFSGALPPDGKLGSLQDSEPETLTFRVVGLRPFEQGDDFKLTVFSLDARLYGKVQTEKSH